MTGHWTELDDITQVLYSSEEIFIVNKIVYNLGKFDRAQKSMEFFTQVYILFLLIFAMKN